MSHSTRINMVNLVPHQKTTVAQLVGRLHALIVCSVTVARPLDPLQLQGGEDT